MEKATTRLRALLKQEGMLYFPAVYYPLGGRMVEQLGFTSELVADGAVALGRIRERQDWGFVLMDWQLPTMDGAEVTRRVRADGRVLPIVGLTAHAGADDRALAVDAGMDACLAKPVRLATLGETLHRLGIVALRG